MIDDLCPIAIPGQGVRTRESPWTPAAATAETWIREVRLEYRPCPIAPMNVLPGESWSSLLKNESAASSPGAGKIEAVRAYSVCDCSEARWIVAVAATYLAGSPRLLMTESIPASYSPAMVPSGPVTEMQLDPG